VVTRMTGMEGQQGGGGASWVPLALAWWGPHRQAITVVDCGRRRRDREGGGGGAGAGRWG
jgi:hypothetical protein